MRVSRVHDMIEMSPNFSASAATVASTEVPPPSMPLASSRRSSLPLRLGLPVRRADLIIAPHGAAGEFVIKDPITGAYFHLGPHESLLLRALNGRNSAEKICRGFEKQFGQPLEVV